MPNYELDDLRISDGAIPHLENVKDFLEHVVTPLEVEFNRLEAIRRNLEGHRWRYLPEQIEILEKGKRDARSRGLWNFFLPNSDVGGLSNLDYAYIAIELGKYELASEMLNCSPPDTGNMEILDQEGTDEQKSQWLEPLLNGATRSAFAMSEPGVASSDARNIALSAIQDGDEYILNGHKYFVSGAGDERCTFLVVMALTDPDRSAHDRHSVFVVPMDTDGVQIEEAMQVFGYDRAPKGQMHISFVDARVPATNLIKGRGHGFAVSQLRLGSARLHHCMRAIGVGEKVIALMVERGETREAFGQPILSLGKNLEVLSRARIELDACRLMVLRAAKAVDLFGGADARGYVSAAKAMIPEKIAQIIDDVIQIFGATGLTQWTPLAELYSFHRGLRIADGPDEVHHRVVARDELRARVAS